jgi:signal peptidase II
VDERTIDDGPAAAADTPSTMTDASDAGSRSAPARSPRAIAVLAIAAVIVVLGDLVTKQLALSNLDGREPVRLLGGLVYLSLTRNSGAAFSLGSDYTFVFPVIATGVVVWIAWMALRLRSVPWGLALGLVLGGALGNLIDRIFRAPGVGVGHVVDMISVFAPYGDAFPVFNLADSALVIGVGLAILLELTGRRRDGSRATLEQDTKR